MMTKKTSQFRNAAKKLALVPLMAGLVFAFSNKVTNAQDMEEMNTSELITALSSKVEAADSISLEEQKALQELVVKLKTNLPTASPKPPQKVRKIPPPPPAKVDTTRYMQIVEKYSEQIHVYLDITPSPQNRTNLKEPYKKLTELYKEGMSIYEKLKKRNEDIRPIAPPPMNPESRMQVYYRQNSEIVKKDTAILNRVADQYAQLLQKYSDISPVSEGNLEYIYKKLTIYHDNWHKIFENTEGVAELAPLPTSPKERIEAYSEKDSGN